MPGIDFYYWPGSAPCRAVQMVADAIGVELNKKYIDLGRGDHRTSEFLKMNPQHCVPLLNDNGFCLWDSHAIVGYLVDKYAEDDRLYPREAQRRALVNQRLFFNATTLYSCFADYYYPVFFLGASQFDPQKLCKLEEAYDFLNTFLEENEWAAGSSITVADYALLASVSTAEAVCFDIKKYSNVNTWYQRVKKAVKSYEEKYHPDTFVFKNLYETVCKKI